MFASSYLRSHRLEPRRPVPAAAHRRWGIAVTRLSLYLRLRTIEYFFKAPGIEALSDRAEVCSLISGIEFMVDEVDEEARVSRVDVAIHTPPEAITEGLEKRVGAGVDEECDVRLRIIERSRSTPWPQAGRPACFAVLGQKLPTARRCGSRKAMLRCG